MATIGFAIAGKAIGAGPIALAVGSIIGSYIDQTYTYPALFPGKDIEAPRLGDFQFQTASEGSPINWCKGTAVRVAGTIIFISDFISTGHKKKVSGKGGGGAQYEKNYTYSVDMALGLCEGEIDDVLKIWADGQLFYSKDVEIDITSAQLEAKRVIEKFYPKINGQYGVSESDPITRRYLLIIESPNGGPDLNQFVSGNDIAVSGFATGGNNDTWKCISANKNTATGVSQVEMIADNGIAPEAAGATVTLQQNINAFDLGEVDDLRIYKGTTTQTADSLLEDYEDAGEVSGFRGLAYIVFEGLQLRDFGNRVPSFAVLVKPSATYNLQEAMTDLHERAGIDSADFDVTALSTTAVKGFNIAGPRAPVNMIKTLMLAYNLIAQVKDGVLTYDERSDVDDVTIDVDNLAAHEEGQNVPRVITLLDKTGIDLPREIDVRFIEPALDYQQSNQKERLIESAADSVIGIDLPLVLTATEARIIAKRELWIMWGTRQTVNFTLPPSQFDILENDRITVPAVPTIAGTETYVILVRKVARGFNRMLEIEGVIEHAEVLDQIATAEEPLNYDVEVFSPNFFFMHIVDIAPFRNEDTDKGGYYYAECMEDPRKLAELGAPAIRRVGSTFHAIPGHPENAAEATIGIATTVLGDRKTEFWDKENTVTIQLRNGDVESEDEIEVLNGFNRIVIGDEVVGFQTATLDSPRTYTLSKLMRGLRNTEWATGKHVANEIVALLTDDTFIFKKMSASSVGVEYEYVDNKKGAVDADEIHSFEYQANTLRPFAPCHIKGVRDASNDLTVDWIRRTRGIIRHFSGDPTPLLEGKERYEFEILDGATVVRVISVRITESPGSINTRTIDGVPWEFHKRTTHDFIYIAAKQTTDGLTPGDPVDLNAFQISGKVGRGKKIEETV